MTLNVEKYLCYLSHYEWSRDEKVEMLRAVWRVMEAEADKAFDLNPVQLSCGQDKNTPSHSQHSIVDSREPRVLSFGTAANDEPHLKKGGQDAA